MHKLIFGAELRQKALGLPVSPNLGSDQHGSLDYRHYNELLGKSADDARVFGQKALLHTVWSPDYDILERKLDDQDDVKVFDDAEIQHILQQKNEIILQYADDFEAKLPGMYTQIMAQVDAFIAQGKLPEYLHDRLQGVIEQTEWFVTDAIPGGLLGRSSPISRHAVISSDVVWNDVKGSTDAHTMQVVTHELMHRSAGAWAVERNGELRPYRSGADHFRSTWLNESVTELLADSLNCGRWNPGYAASNPNDTYVGERGALALLLDLIKPDALVAYYFAEDDDDASKKELQRVFREELGVTLHGFIKATEDPGARAKYLRGLRQQK